MVTRQEKREATQILIDKYQISKVRSCRVINFPLSSFRYQFKAQQDLRLIDRMKYWAEQRPRYGHPRIHEKLKRDGFEVNHKKTERLYYNVLKLSLRRKVKKRKRYRTEIRTPIEMPTTMNKVWSMDFVSDQIASGRRVRGLTVVDVFSKINQVLEFEYNLSGIKVRQILENVCSVEGYPEIITVDNGPEFICMALDRWAYEKEVKLKFSRPGKPTDNPFIESFNGKVRDEFLNMHWFENLWDLREKAIIWQEEYNFDRPHSALGMKTPMEFISEHTKPDAIELIG